MKILLVRPISKTPVITPFLSLGYLATALKKDAHQVSILDCSQKELSYLQFQKAVSQENPDLVGFSCFTVDADSVKQSAELVKEIKPTITTVIGGPHPTAIPEQVLKLMPAVDFAFQGEAEIGLPKLVKNLEAVAPHAFQERDTFSQNASEVPGLIWLMNGSVKINPSVFVEDLDQLGYPAWDLIKPEDYPHSPHGGFAKNFPVAPIFITRGCPYQCTFCAGNKVGGRKVRKRSIPHVLEEIRLLVNKHGIREIHIEDDNFTFYPDYAKEFCQTILEAELGISWSCPNGVRMDTLDAELLRLMKKSGCYCVLLGIESGSSIILKHMRKKITKEKIREKVQLISEAGIQTFGSFIVGYPAESPADIKETIDFACELPLTRAVFNNFLPLPGTEIYQHLIQTGQIQPVDISKLADSFSASGEVSYAPPGMTTKQLYKLQRWGTLRFYLRPKPLWNFLTELRSLKQIWYIIKRTFGFFLSK